ncbi:MAG: tRNA (adenosine(37)-N6)-dimethylallyltransferase MiaA [Patescibacteria group bacterium]
MKKVIAIIGPTASGKTALSIELAKKFSGEIICIDSRTMYKGMDIATAKPTLKEQQFIPHYLIDLVNPGETLTVSEFKSLAKDKINEIISRGKIPFLVGGSGLYLDSIVYGFEMPPEGNPALRLQLEKMTNEELFEKLKKLDPVHAQKIDSKNPRRLVRAVEVCMLTGKPFSKQIKKIKPDFKTLILGIDVAKEKLASKISSRVDMMIKDGLVDEVRNLSEKYSYNLPAMSSVGYREINSYLLGQISLNEAIMQMKKNTLDYARRQITWFKKNKDIVWLTNITESDEKIKKFAKKFATGDQIK